MDVAVVSVVLTTGSLRLNVAAAECDLTSVGLVVAAFCVMAALIFVNDLRDKLLSSRRREGSTVTSVSVLLVVLLITENKDFYLK